MADLKNKYLELKSKEENKRRVIILKDGIFYRTYDNDAVII